MNIFSYSDYRTYLRSKISSLPKKGRGQIEKIASHLGVHQSFLSQILGDTKTLSEEQAIEISKYFSLTESETEYLITLVQIDRTAHPSLVKLGKQRLQRIRSQIQGSPQVAALSENERAIYYSSWTYSAVRLLTDSPEYNSADKISAQIGLSVAEVNVILEFLVKVGLCNSKDGKLSMAKKRTFITGDSPAYGRHLLNWRLKAIEQIQKNPNVPFAYTSPMIISQDDAHKVRDILQDAIQKIDALVEPSKSEKIFCLNIDWFKL